MIAIKTFGAGDPLVLLHGVNTTHAIWQRVHRSLGSGRLVATPDLPGFGDSPPIGEGFDLEQVADALAEELSAQVLAPFDLLGHSLGGAVALTLAHQRPELVRRLVLVAPAGFRPKGSFVAQVEGHGYAAIVDIRDVVGKLLIGTAIGRFVLFGSVVAEPARLAPAHARLMLEASTGGTPVRKAIIAVETADLRPLLSDLDLHLGLIWGDHDRLVPFDTLNALCALAPNAEVETIPNAGHMPQIERPRKFAMAVKNLLE